jgi:hypothetical protein
LHLPSVQASFAQPSRISARAAANGPGAAKSTDDLGPAFGDDLTAMEVCDLMTTEFARFATVLRHAVLAGKIPVRPRAALAA